MQNRLTSFLEANLNTFSGFFISMIVGYFLYPLYGMKQSMKTAFEITLIYTAISIFRNYIIRRFFNRFVKRKQV